MIQMMPQALEQEKKFFLKNQKPIKFFLKKCPFHIIMPLVLLINETAI